MSEPAVRPSGLPQDAPLWNRILQATVALGRELATEASLATLIVTSILVLRVESGHEAALAAALRNGLQGIWTPLGQPLFQAQVIAVTLQLGLPLLAILAVHRKSLADYGLGLGDVRFWLPLTVAIVAIQVVVVWGFLSRDPAYIHRYPSLAAARHGGSIFWAWESSRVLYMVSWEFLFRGYLLFALARRIGLASCALQTVPFVLMHIISGKPPSEVFFTIGSGVLSGLFALEARSIWPIVFLHSFGAVLLDVLIVFR